MKRSIFMAVLFMGGILALPLAAQEVVDAEGDLRENYIQERIYKVGQMVENLNTGLVGKIIRRGTNYLICVTEDKIMFKSWIKDVSEAVTNTNTPSGVPADQRLVGTDAFRKYVETMVPGSERGKQFINKYRKK